MPFFRRTAAQHPQKRPPVRAELATLVRAHMPDADEEDIHIATAIAGLFAVVAYVDRHYAPQERQRIRDDLTRLPMFQPAAVDAVCELLDRRIVELSASNSQSYTRTLRELLDVAGRREVLSVLVDLAAADGTLAHEEVESLRRLTGALGLGPDDYLAAQDRHRDRLSSLD